MSQHSLLSDITAFIDRNQMSESTFGRRAVSDWRLIRDMRNGRRLWPETEEKVRTFMSGHPQRPDA